MSLINDRMELAATQPTPIGDLSLPGSRALILSSLARRGPALVRRSRDDYFSGLSNRI